jgi:hypothetical protein
MAVTEGITSQSFRRDQAAPHEVPSDETHPDGDTMALPDGAVYYDGGARAETHGVSRATVVAGNSPLGRPGGRGSRK